MKYPKIRPVNAFPVMYSGKRMICLKDTTGLAENTVVIPEQVFFIASMLNGENAVRDIQAAYIRRFGDLVFSERIQEVIDDLDRNLLLEGERFEAHVQKLMTEFKRAASRPFPHKGDTPQYEPTHLRREIASYYSPPDGPGDVSLEIAPGSIKGVMLPHIDYMRGGTCYAWGYRALEALDDAATFVVLAVNHMAGEPFFSITPKTFETPLGLMDTDTDFVEALIEHCDQDLLAGEFYHRNEHSVELQTIWLKYLYPDNDVKIVPMLCGGFERFIAEGTTPIQDAGVRDFINGAKKTIATSSRQVCLMASVDLSHIGPQFGAERHVSPGDLIDIRSADLETLKSIEAVDMEGFWQSIAKDGNQRNICGLSAIYTLLGIVTAREGRLLKYSQWRDEQGWGCVTFASMVFSE